MNCRRQLAFVLIVATAIAAIGSHLLTKLAKVHTTVSEPLTFGKPNGEPPAFRAGSSLADYQIDWNEIARETKTEIKAWGVGGGSPAEFEQFQKKVPEARTTYIVVSTYDLDEADVCDFRANIVPISQTIQTLLAIHADWQDSKRALSQYPMTWLRTLFPSIGRSRAIMGMLHEKVKNWIRPSASPSGTMTRPTLEVGNEKVADPYRLQKVSDWSESQLIGKFAAQRAGLQGSDSFNGPKHLALLRMLQYGCQRGRTIVVVVPVSAAYSKKFMTPELAREFEAALADAQRCNPKAEWVRLDQSPGLDSDENFCDLVHMNVSGQKLATGAFAAWLKQPVHQP
jgi:hypothetical protein